jgi:AcrR family transcriptional regulator
MRCPIGVLLVRSGHLPTLVGNRPFSQRPIRENVWRMPTGTAILDAREQLFAAAERVLLRDGPNALTSRAVTTEAGVAKGVLHRHFADFDGFLAELVIDRIAALQDQAASLRASAGSGTVAGNLTRTLTALFESVAVAIVGLVTSRYELLERLRATTPTGIPLLTEAAGMLISYLVAERELGRIAGESDLDALGPALIGAGHMLFVGRGSAPGADEVNKVVTTVIAGAVPAPSA